MLEVINLFLIPCVTLYLYYRRRNKEPVFSAGFLLEYGIATVAVYLASKIIYIICCKIWGFEFTEDSYGGLKYAVIALAVACMLPGICDYVKSHFSIHLNVRKNEGARHREKKRIWRKKRGSEEAAKAAEASDGKTAEGIHEEGTQEIPANTENQKKKKDHRFRNAVICGIPFVLALFLVFLVNWFMETYGFSFAQLVYTLTSPLQGTGTSVIVFVAQSCLPPLLGIIIVYVIAAYLLCQRRITVHLDLRLGRKQIHLDVLRLARRAGVLVCVAALVMSVLYADSQIGISDYIELRSSETTIYEDYYVDPTTVDISLGGEGKNLIYIYLESMETTYLSVEEGGYQEINYIPNLTALAQENLSFSDSDLVGGFVSLTGTDYTMGALLATSTGLPLAFPVEQNGMDMYENFATGMTSLGDILEEYGYNQEFLCGSPAEFAGRESFFTQHGNFEIFDYDCAVEAGYIDSGYFVWWGFEDSYLYEIAKDELTALAAEDEPFNFTMLTVDTHHYDGYVCTLCGDEYDVQLANVLQCADNQIAEFIEWCMQQDFYEDTVIVITGDHPRMDTTLVDGVDYEDRTVYNCIINSDTEVEGETTNRQFTSMDMFPTVLAAMGFEIEGEKLGLGTNLFSGEETLLELLGYDYMQEELSKYSQFYIDEFK